MELSKHNILSRVYHSEKYFIINLLSGNADILTEQEAGLILKNTIPDDPEIISKGYVVDPTEENKLFRKKYLDFIDARETDEVQLFFAPTYECNFNCSYCYQDDYANLKGESRKEVTDAFFTYVNEHFAGRKKYITLFGGEPLLTGNRNIEFITYFIEKCNQAQLELAIVTNGYNLTEYLPVISMAKIRELQVTLDGTETIHNLRRHLKDGSGTFSRIADGIDSALGMEIPVNLRVVLDRENIGTLPELAEFACIRGWTTLASFKTQLGRNYELHHCQSEQSKLYSRVELYRDLYDLIMKYPVITEFHKPAYSVSKFLFENGELPDPLFDSCPGCKTEWAFDYTGKIYSCTATVGKAGEELGSFYPEVMLYNEKITTWQQRDVLTIPACRTCNVRLACGGGCASVAYNRDNDLNAPDCRPVKELLEMGIALYKFEV
jgi:uncharacterized protein